MNFNLKREEGAHQSIKMASLLIKAASKYLDAFVVNSADLKTSLLSGDVHLDKAELNVQVLQTLMSMPESLKLVQATASVVDIKVILK